MNETDAQTDTHDCETTKQQEIIPHPVTGVRTRKVVINNAIGHPFDMCQRAVERYARYAGIELVRAPEPWKRPMYYITTKTGPQLWCPAWMDRRDDPDLVRVVTELGADVNANGSLLTVVDIPADIEWYVVAENGLEYVVENHRRWYGPVV